MAADAVDLQQIAQIIGAGSGAVTAPVVVWLFVTGRIVRGSELDKKDAALERKDAQIQTLQAGIVAELVPAVTRATDVLKAYQNQVVVPKVDP